MTRPWKVGILGAGYIADWHCRALRAVPGVELVAACDLAPARAEALARAHRIPTACSSLDALLAAGPDVVHVLLPADAHFDAAHRLLERGAHVLLEKPMCLTVEECAALEEEAQRHGRVLGVSHNFLFAPIWERLRADVVRGELGPIDHVSITWHKELPALRSGPSGTFALRSPGNILLEVVPHAAASLLDLIGVPERVQADAEDRIVLPSGVAFYRRWLVRAFRGRTCAEVRLAFGPGFPEQSVHVRGVAGSATADFERNTYVLRRSRGRGPDFDRYDLGTGEGRSLVRQARGNLLRYVLSKFRVLRHGNAFEESISRSLRAFYASLPGTPTGPASAVFGREVVALCRRIGAAAGVSLREPERRISTGGGRQADVLVLGGTGFIGRALVRRLVETGRSVRLLARDPAGLPRALQGLPLDVVRGDLGGDALEQALRGVACVYHLARPTSARTWSDYLRQDVDPTRAVGDACLRHGVRRLIYTGTIDSYYSGDPRAVIDERTPLDPCIGRRNLYARSKAEGERVLLEMHRERGLPVVIFRPGVVVGPGGSPFHWGVGFWPAESVCRFWGEGTNPLPFVLATDVAEALAAACAADAVEGEAFNLVSEPCLDARGYVAALEQAAGVRIDARPCPAWRTWLADLGKWGVKCLVRHPDRRLPSYRDWQTRAHLARFDCSKARRILGWSPNGSRERLVEEGVVRATVEWLERES